MRHRRALIAGTGAIVAGAGMLLAGCVGDPVYKAAKAETVATVAESVVELPPPPPLPPPPAASDLNELRARDDYVQRLRPGDVLAVTVREEPELSLKQTRVGRDGTLRLPWLGTVEAAGRTSAELERDLEDRLRRTVLKAPEVSVEIVPGECRKVYVLGRVGHPGAFTLPIDQRFTLVQLITIAGGFVTAKTELEADASAIRLIRTVKGVRRTFRISFEEIFERGDLDRDVAIEPDDVVYVPPKREVYIFGSVQRPGTFPLADGGRLSIDEVLSLAGGFGPTAERNRVTVIRRGSTGNAESYHVNMTDEKQRATTQVTANDTVIVSDRQTRRVFVLGNVARPGSFELDEKGLTVIKVLALAGGLNRIADGDAVRLLRSTPEGRKIYRVPVNSIIRQGETGNDPVLVPGDLIFVPESLF